MSERIREVKEWHIVVAAFIGFVFLHYLGNRDIFLALFQTSTSFAFGTTIGYALAKLIPKPKEDYWICCDTCNHENNHPEMEPCKNCYGTDKVKNWEAKK